MNLLALLIPSIMVMGDVSFSYEQQPDENIIITLADVPDYVTDVYIPETIDDCAVSEIKDFSFMGCVSAKKIVIPSTVSSVGSGAFMSCTSLEEVYMGSSQVRNLPNDCFFACPSLKRVILPEFLESIGAEAFFGCSELDLYVPPSVTFIGNNAFGKHTDPHLNDTVLIHGFLVKGVTGSYAETYSAENNIDFIDMNNYRAGDVDNDSFVDASDASLILEEYARASTGVALMFTRKQKIVSDMDSNGVIDAGDASSVLQIYAELSTSH